MHSRGTVSAFPLGTVYSTPTSLMLYQIPPTSLICACWDAVDVCGTLFIFSNLLSPEDVTGQEAPPMMPSALVFCSQWGHSTCLFNTQMCLSRTFTVCCLLVQVSSCTFFDLKFFPMAQPEVQLCLVPLLLSTLSQLWQPPVMDFLYFIISNPLSPAPSCSECPLLNPSEVPLSPTSLRSC